MIMTKIMPPGLKQLFSGGEFKFDSISMSVQTDAAELIQTRVIDGQEFFLVPVTDNVTVNGIRDRKRESK